MKVKVKMLVVQLRPTFCDSTDCSHQASMSMEFSRQEYWTGLLFPSSGDLPHPEMEFVSVAFQADSGNHLSHQGSPKCVWKYPNTVNGSQYMGYLK